MNKENGQTFNQLTGIPKEFIKELAKLFDNPSKICEEHLLHGENIQVGKGVKAMSNEIYLGPPPKPEEIKTPTIEKQYTAVEQAKGFGVNVPKETIFVIKDHKPVDIDPKTVFKGGTVG